MKTYTQLTRGKRYQIRALLKARISESKMAFWGAKRAILGSLHREVRDQGSRVGSREYLDLYRRFLRPKWHYRDDKYLFLLSLSFDIRNVNA